MKRLILLIFILFVTSAILTAQTATAPSSGDGSPSSPYQIASLENLYWIAESSTRWNMHYIQTADINASATETWVSGAGWTPIGNGTPFTGSYKGRGYTISNLYVDRPTTNNVGLFGHVGQGTQESPVVIRDLHLVNVNISGGRGAGTLAGRVTGNIYTLIEGCSASGAAGTRSVSGGAAVGGLVGSNNSHQETPGGTDNPIISKCWADIDVVYSGADPGSGLDAEKFGGLAGCNQKGTIRNAFAKGSVTVERPASSGWVIKNVGGLAGCILYRGIIDKVYSTGAVTSTGSDILNVGGLVGNVSSGGNAGVVENGYWDTQSSGQTTSAGNSIGLSSAEINDPAYLTGFDFDNIWVLIEEKIALQEVPLTTYITWTGAHDTDWNNTGNWSSVAKPVSTDIAVIPEGLSRYPVITTTITDVPKGLTINAIAGLSIKPGHGLTIPGFLLNSAGSDGFIIEADATGSGSLINNTLEVLASVEHYIPASQGTTWPSKKYTQATEWFYISQPVIEQDISVFLTGLTSYDLYRWSESDDTWYNHKAAGFNQTQFSMTEGYLFAAPVIHTPTYQGELFAGTFRIDNLSASGSGNPNTGTSQYYAAGWHLMGNPYPSGLVFDESWTMDGLVKTVKTWSNDNGTYIDVAAGFMPPMTAFFVQVDAGFDNNNTLVVPAAARAHAAPVTKSMERDRIIIAAIGVESQMKQQSIIRLETDTKEGFDARYDSRFLAGYAPPLYAVTETDRLSTLSVRDTDPERFIPFGFEKNDGETDFQILLEENVGDTEIYLLDKKQNVCHKLDRDTPYAFDSEADDDPMRFELHFQEVQVETGMDDELLQPHSEIFVHGQTLHMTFGKEAGERTLEVFDINGRRIIHQTLGTGTAHTTQLGFHTGVYIVRITSTDETETKRIFVKQE